MVNTRKKNGSIVFKQSWRDNLVYRYFPLEMEVAS